MGTRGINRLLLIVTFVAGCTAAPSPPPKQPLVSARAPEPAEPRGPYVMAYFTHDGFDGLYLAGSTDGLTWTPLFGGRTVIKPAISKQRLLRDPNLLRGPDGTFHVVWTAAAEEPVIGYASSRDLVTWSEQRGLNVMAGEPRTKNVWGPKLFYDQPRSRFMIIWASAVRGRFVSSDGSAEEGLNHRIYYTTTPDFVQLAPARLLYDPGFSVIDALIVQDGARYLMFVKDERRNPWKKHLMLSTATDPEGPWSPPGPPITGNFPAEAPSTIKVSQTRFLYFERYAEQKLGVTISTDLTNWKDISSLLTPPPYARNPSIISVSSDLFARLRRLP